MNGFVFDLLFGSGHKISNSGLSVFSPVCLYVGNFEVKQLAIEPCEERQQEKLLSLKPEVTIAEIKGPSPGCTLGKHKEIFCTGNKSKDTKPTQKDKGLTSCEAEMLIMRGYWLSTSQLRFCF